VQNLSPSGTSNQHDRTKGQLMIAALKKNIEATTRIGFGEVPRPASSGHLQFTKEL